MSILRISVLLLIFCAAACKNPIDKSESQMSAGLSVPPGHPGRQSAVAIAEIHENGVGILCSGVLVAENLVVTAAHCIGGKEPKQLRVFFGEDANSGIFRPVTATRTFRQNNELGGRRYYPNFDIAWMRIGGTLPAGASPTPILFDAKTLGQGTLSSIVGVAATNTDESRALGVKFAADLIVERHLDHPLAQGLIIYAPRSGSVATCGNETGGPAYVKVQGEWFVAGINNGTPQHFVKSEPGGCREGVQTALSHYKGWIETSAGVDLAGPTKSAKAEAWPTEVPNHMAFKDWCEDPNLPERFWFFLQELASRVSVLPSDCDAFEKAIYDVGMQGFATEPELLPLLKTLSGLKDLTIALDRRDPANQRLSLKDIISLKELRRLVLYVNEAELKDLDALGELPYLEELEIYTDTNLNLVHFRKLAGLRVLKLHQAGLQDVSPLAELKNLDVLELPYNLIDNLAPLTVLTGLMELNLDRNGLNDITPIKALTGLKKLSLRENNIGDASPLSALTNLTDLDLSYNRIADLKALSGLSLLQRLRVIANPMRYGCQMSDQTFSKSVCQF